MRNSNRQWILKKRPVGDIKPGDLELVEQPIPVPGRDQILVRTLYLSLDPTNRIWMSDMEQYMPPVTDRRRDARRHAGRGRAVEQSRLQNWRDRQRHRRLAGIFGRRRRAEDGQGSGAAARLHERARHDRRDGLFRPARSGQAASGRDRRRLGGGGRGRLHRRPDRQAQGLPRRRPRRLATRSAAIWSRISASTPASTTRRKTSARR